MNLKPPEPNLDETLKLKPGFPGTYPWDDWERFAIANGLDPKMATLGRAVVREAYQHDWNTWVKSLCGWQDNGKRMLKFALQSPDEARVLWECLLKLDGDYD